MFFDILWEYLIFIKMQFLVKITLFLTEKDVKYIWISEYETCLRSGGGRELDPNIKIIVLRNEFEWKYLLSNLDRTFQNNFASTQFSGVWLGKMSNN